MPKTNEPIPIAVQGLVERVQPPKTFRRRLSAILTRAMWVVRYSDIDLSELFSAVMLLTAAVTILIYGPRAMGVQVFAKVGALTPLSVLAAFSATFQATALLLTHRQARAASCVLASAYWFGAATAFSLAGNMPLVTVFLGALGVLQWFILARLMAHGRGEDA